jgi:Outer membrane protein beta-barrel domain
VHTAGSVAAFLLVWNAVLPTLHAQRYEAGIQLTGVHLHKIDEGLFGIGARFHYNLTSVLAGDLELTHYPENSAGNFGESTILVGLRAGKHFNRFGAFIKGRPGWIHFGGDYFSSRLDHKTHFIVDLGGMLEYYPTLHTFVRLEGGDTVIYYGEAKLFNRPSPDALGTVHNFQSGAGFGFRF